MTPCCTYSESISRRNGGSRCRWSFSLSRSFSEEQLGKAQQFCFANVFRIVFDIFHLHIYISIRVNPGSGVFMMTK